MFGKRLMKTAMALLLIGLAQTTFAQEIIPGSFELKTAGTLQLAEEVFGTRPADVALATAGRATVIMELVQGGSIWIGTIGELTFRLSGEARFGVRDLVATDLASLPRPPERNPTLEPVITGPNEGGERGGSSVSFRITSREDAQATIPAFITLNDGVQLTIPGLQNLVGLRDGDRITVEVAVALIDIGEQNPMNNVGVWPDLDPFVHDPPRSWITNDVLLEVLNQFTLRVTGDGDTVNIDPASPASFLAEEDAVRITNVDGEEPGEVQGIELGGVRMEQSATPYKGPDGETDFALAEADQVRISVQASGATAAAFDQALVFIDLDDDLTIDPEEVFDPEEVLPNEQAQADSTSITFSATSAVVTDTLLTKSSLVYLVPNGKAPIRQAAYTLRLELDFADATFLDDSDTSPATMLVREGPSLVLEDVQFRLETTPLALAAELFGDSSSATIPAGTQTITLTVRDDTGVSKGAEAAIEYRLADGIQFAEPLSAANLRFRPSRNNIDSRGILSLISGGLEGDNRVRFRLLVNETSTDFSAAGLAGGDQLILTLPVLRTLGGLRAGDERGVQVRLTPTVTTPDFNFRNLNPLTDGEEGSLITSNTLVRVGRQFTLQAEGSGITPEISVVDNTEFSSGAISIMLSNDDRVQGIRLGWLGIERAAENYLSEDGMTAFDLVGRDRLRLAVSGDNLPDGVRAFIDLDGGQDLDTAEVIAFTDGLTLSASGAGARALLSANRAVYLLTDGEALLEPGGYTASLTLDFANDDYLDASVTTPVLTTTLGGLRRQGFAYALPNCTQVERASIHIVNETRQPLRLFVQGFDQSGMDLGLAELDASLLRGNGAMEWQPGEGLDLLTEHIEQLFNLNDGGFGRTSRCTAADTWRGRAQLAFFANGTLTLVPQIRGSLGELRELGGFTGLHLGGEVID